MMQVEDMCLWSKNKKCALTWSIFLDMNFSSFWETSEVVVPLEIEMHICHFAFVMLDHASGQSKFLNSIIADLFT